MNNLNQMIELIKEELDYDFDSIEISIYQASGYISTRKGLEREIGRWVNGKSTVDDALFELKRKMEANK